MVTYFSRSPKHSEPKKELEPKNEVNILNFKFIQNFTFEVIEPPKNEVIELKTITHCTTDTYKFKNQKR